MDQNAIPSPEARLSLSTLFCAILIVGLLIIAFFSPAQAAPRPRVIILTDIGTHEPDDYQSFCRLLLYTNELQVEGLITTTSCWQGAQYMNVMKKAINAYGQVHANLVKHDKRYPSSGSLLNMTRTGQTGVGMNGVGKGKSSPGSKLIVQIMDKKDSRPVYIGVWGGANTLAQALWDVKNTRSKAELDRFVSKLRVKEECGQDNSSAWIAKTFPKIYFIRNRTSWTAMAPCKVRMPGVTGEIGGDNSVVTEAWFDKNVRKGHGALGATYPRQKYCWEGDTPSYLGLIPRGLSHPDDVHYGNWAGRYTLNKVKTPKAFSGGRVAPLEKPYYDFWMKTEDTKGDTWKYGSKTYTNSMYACVWRWRVAFQHDFAARWDWCVKPFSGANHNPIAVVDDDTSTDVIRMKAESGDTVALDAKGSYDPDKNGLRYRWFCYKEPGTYGGTIKLLNSASQRVRFVVPKVTKVESVHVVLELKDTGTPALYNYRRVVVALHKKTITEPGIQSQSMPANGVRPSGQKAVLLRGTVGFSNAVPGVGVYDIKGRLLGRSDSQGKIAWRPGIARSSRPRVVVLKEERR